MTFRNLKPQLRQRVPQQLAAGFVTVHQHPRGLHAAVLLAHDVFARLAASQQRLEHQAAALAITYHLFEAEAEALAWLRQVQPTPTREPLRAKRSPGIPGLFRWVGVGGGQWVRLGAGEGLWGPSTRPAWVGFTKGTAPPGAAVVSRAVVVSMGAGWSPVTGWWFPEGEWLQAPSAPAAASNQAIAAFFIARNTAAC